MSRSGYSDDCEHLDLWRQAVARAIAGGRGQRFLRALLGALDAMPAKRLIAYEITRDGEVCALGAVDPAPTLDPDDRKAVSRHYGIAEALAAEIMFINDEGAYRVETPEQRWERVRLWVESQITSGGNKRR